MDADSEITLIKESPPFEGWKVILTKNSTGNYTLLNMYNDSIANRVGGINMKPDNRQGMRMLKSVKVYGIEYFIAEKGLKSKLKSRNLLAQEI